MVMLGRFFRNRFLKKDEQEYKGGVNSLLGALFGLWGFIVAFTFGSSASRFDNVRSMMVEEANTIRTAILRTQTFPDTIGTDLYNDLKPYLEARIAYYDYASDFDKLNKARQDAEDIGKRMWTKTVHASRLPNMALAGSNMLATLSSMYDLGARRDALLLSGVPDPIIYMLFFLAMAISFIGGFTTPVIHTKEWIVIAGFILLATVIIYLTLDLGRPLRGFIRPDVGEARFLHLRDMF